MGLRHVTGKAYEILTQAQNTGTRINQNQCGSTISLCLTNSTLRHKDAWGNGCIIHIFLTSALAGGEWSALRPGCFNPGENPRYPSDMRLGGPQSRCRQLKKSVVLVRKRTIPTERLVPNFADRGCRAFSATDPHGHYLNFLDPESLLFHSSTSSVILTRLIEPHSRTTTSQKYGKTRESSPGTLDLWQV
jgi:hypothetical protein